MLICAECQTKIPKGDSWCPRCGPDPDRALQDHFRSEEIRRDEKAFNDGLIAKAREKGAPVSAIASDGCEVTACPNGAVFYNAADWW